METSDFKKALENQMEKAKRQNGLEHRGAFVTDEFLMALFTKENLHRHIGEHVQTGKREFDVRSKLVEAIYKNGRRLYAILVLLDEAWRIKDLLLANDPVDDRILFGKVQERYPSYCTVETLHKIPQLSDVAEDFYKKQWHFPPLLSAKEIRTFPANLFMFPFLTVRYIGRGGQGTVMEAEIANGYLLYPKGQEVESKIAYKRIPRMGDSKEWHRLADEVKTLWARPHSHVTPLLASFIAGLEKPQNPWLSQECLFMISPLAEMDMEKWMMGGDDETRLPTYFTSLKTDGLRHHIYNEAMLGLISGVAFIHREIEGIVGYHRDLKPKNILLFARPSWTWKICDFGCANLKPVHDTGTLDPMTTPYWAPPEFFQDSFKTKGQTHGRSHDIYSIGCVFLLLATIIQFGWKPEGLQEFERQRAGKDGEEPYTHNDKSAFHNNKRAVEQWIQRLKTKAKREQDTRVLEIIAEMLLPREERISAWETEVYLYEAVDTARPERQVLEKMQKVIEASRDVDPQMKNNVVMRAEKWGRSKHFFAVLKEKRWYDHPPQTTTALKERTKDVRRADDPYSTLPTVPNPEDEPLFGYQGYFDRISQVFEMTDTVALSGLGGIGKSRIALYYASQLTRRESEFKKHAFWVSGRTVAQFQDSYGEIAKKITAPVDVRTNRDKMVSHVKQWLEDRMNGQWILVVDGFDITSEAAQIRKYLPKQGCGQIMITTRNRGLVDGLVSYHKDACMEMDIPDDADLLCIYQHYIDKTIFNRAKEDTQDLLSRLRLPKLIIDAAKYMNARRIPPREVLEDIRKHGFSAVETFSTDLAKYLLQPTITRSLEERCPEIERLSLFAFFDSSGIDLDLAGIEINQTEHQNHRDTIATLENCYLIRKGEHAADALYAIDGTVRSAVLAWIKRTEGEVGLLKRYNKTLSMMYIYYAKKKDNIKKRRSKHADVAGAVFELKRRLMPHFERFLSFIDNNLEVDFNLSDRAVQAITLFSGVLMDQDFHDKATQVLEFAKSHYPNGAEAQEDQTQRTHNIRFALTRQLVKTYLAHAPDEVYLNAAETLVKNELNIWEHPDRMTHAWAGKSVRTWELLLDLVRVYWESSQWDAAWEKLSLLSNIKVRMWNNEPVLPKHEDEKLDLGNGAANGARKEQEARRAQLRRLAIQVNKEEGLFYLARARELEAQNSLKATKRSRLAARDVLRTAQSALCRWFPQAEDKLLEEVTLGIADVDTKLGAPGTLASMASPASAYRGQGQWKETEGLDLSANDVTSRREQYPLSAHSNMDNAGASSQQGQINDDRLSREAPPSLPGVAALVNSRYQSSNTVDQRKADVPTTEEVVKAGAGIYESGQEVVRLLDRRGADAPITEDMVNTAAGNGESGKEVTNLFENGPETKTIEESAASRVMSLKRNRRSDRAVSSVFASEQQEITEATSFSDYHALLEGQAHQNAHDSKSSSQQHEEDVDDSMSADTVEMTPEEDSEVILNFADALYDRIRDLESFFNGSNTLFNALLETKIKKFSKSVKRDNPKDTIELKPKRKVVKAIHRLRLHISTELEKRISKNIDTQEQYSRDSGPEEFSGRPLPGIDIQQETLEQRVQRLYHDNNENIQEALYQGSYDRDEGSESSDSHSSLPDMRPDFWILHGYFREHPAFDDLILDMRRLIRHFRINTLDHIQHSVSQVGSTELNSANNLHRKVEVCFHADWDLLRFLKERQSHGLGDGLGSVLTITGNSQEAQLNTVAQFIRQTWKTQFDALLPALHNEISGQNVPQPDAESSATKITLEKGRVSALVVGSKDFVVAVAQQVAWLGATCRPSEHQSPSVTRRHPYYCDTLWEQDQSSPNTFRISYDVVPLDQDELSPSWTFLIDGACIATGYPIGERSGYEIGLQLPVEFLEAEERATEKLSFRHNPAGFTTKCFIAGGISYDLDKMLQGLGQPRTLATLENVLKNSFHCETMPRIYTDDDSGLQPSRNSQGYPFHEALLAALFACLLLIASMSFCPDIFTPAEVLNVGLFPTSAILLVSLTFPLFFAPGNRMKMTRLLQHFRRIWTSYPNFDKSNERELGPGCSRVGWTCTCGEEFNQDFSAREGLDAIDVYSNFAIAGYRVILQASNAPDPESGRTFQQTYQAPINESSHLGHRSAPVNEGHNEAADDAAVPNNVSDPNLLPLSDTHGQDPAMTDDADDSRPTLSTDSPGQRVSKWVLFCFDYDEFAHRAEHVPFKDLVNDDRLLKELCRRYHAQKVARWINWFQSNPFFAYLVTLFEKREVKAISFARFQLCTVLSGLEPMPLMQEAWDSPDGCRQMCYSGWEPQPMCKRPNIPDGWLLHVWKHSERRYLQWLESCKLGVRNTLNHSRTSLQQTWSPHFKKLREGVEAFWRPQSQLSNASLETGLSTSNPRNQTVLESQNNNNQPCGDPLTLLTSQGIENKKSYVLLKIPKKVRDEMEPGNGDDAPCGWGLYVEEERRSKGAAVLPFIMVVMLMFIGGLAYSVATKSWDFGSMFIAACTLMFMYFSSVLQ